MDGFFFSHQATVFPYLEAASFWTPGTSSLSARPRHPHFWIYLWFIGWATGLASVGAHRRHVPHVQASKAAGRFGKHQGRGCDRQARG